MHGPTHMQIHKYTCSHHTHLHTKQIKTKCFHSWVLYTAADLRMRTEDYWRWAFGFCQPSNPTNPLTPRQFSSWSFTITSHLHITKAALALCFNPQTVGVISISHAYNNSTCSAFRASKTPSWKSSSPAVELRSVEPTSHPLKALHLEVWVVSVYKGKMGKQKQHRTLPEEGLWKTQPFIIM